MSGSLKTGPYVMVLNEGVLREALEYARGSYQVDILLGWEALSGATLRGRAKEYTGNYRRSAESLIRRLQEKGLPIREIRGKYGKRILVIG